MASPTPPQRDLTLLRHFREEMENTPRNDQQALLATLNKFGDQYAAEVERGAVSVEEAAEILTDVASDYLDVDQSAVLDPVLVKLDQAEERRLQRLEEPPKPTGPAARLIWDGDVVAQQSVRYLVDTILPETGVGLLVGQWGVYKTFVAMYLAACVITGQKFINFDVERKGGVLFLAAEKPEEVPIRSRAALEHAGIARVGSVRARVVDIDPSFASTPSRPKHGCAQDQDALFSCGCRYCAMHAKAPVKSPSKNILGGSDNLRSP